MSRTTSIAIDAMGGDHAPREVVLGVARATRELADVELILVGREPDILREFEAASFAGGLPGCVRIVHADEVIGMGDKPVDALRKKKGSSIETALRLVREGQAQAFLSAGNTGACVAASQLFLRLLPGARRAGILVTLRVGDQPLCITDVGANVDAKPEHLEQYGVMGSLFAERILGVASPRVGLLNVGAEDEKGTELVRRARGLIAGQALNFVGYVEGDELYHDRCDVVVCDGFTGNVVLKLSEGLATQIVGLVGRAFRATVAEFAQRGGRGGDPGCARSGGDASESSVGSAGVDLGELFQRSAASLRQRLDYSEYGGAPLLGVDGTVIIAHGRSDANAIFNGIRVAHRMVEVDFNRHLAERLEA